MATNMNHTFLIGSWWLFWFILAGLLRGMEARDIAAEPALSTWQSQEGVWPGLLESCLFIIAAVGAAAAVCAGGKETPNPPSPKKQRQVKAVPSLSVVATEAFGGSQAPGSPGFPLGLPPRVPRSSDLFKSGSGSYSVASSGEIVKLHGGEVAPLPPLRKYSSSQLSANFLLEGTLGPDLYRGIILEDRSVVAVRRLPPFMSGGGSREQELLSAFSTLSSIRHPNIQALKGYSVSGGRYMLVYEHAASDGAPSLASLLFNTDADVPTLSWPERKHVAESVASALAYLHEAFMPPIPCGKVEADSILMLENGTSDEISKSPLLTGVGPQNLLRSQSLSTYTSPASPTATPPSKSRPSLPKDVLYFGLLLFELLCGRSVKERDLRGNGGLLGKALFMMASGKAPDGFVDVRLRVPVLLRQGSRGVELSSMVSIAAACCQEDAERRPRMGDVVISLQAGKNRKPRTLRDSMNQPPFIGNGVRPASETSLAPGGSQDQSLQTESRRPQWAGVTESELPRQPSSDEVNLGDGRDEEEGLPPRQNSLSAPSSFDRQATQVIIPPTSSAPCSLAIAPIIAHPTSIWENESTVRSSSSERRRSQGEVMRSPGASQIVRAISGMTGEELNDEDVAEYENWMVGGDFLLDQIDLKEVVGGGSFGTLHHGVWLGTDIAVKVIRNAFTPGGLGLKGVWREVAILRELRHPNVVLFMGAIAHPPNEVWIVTEYIPQGSLYDVLHLRRQSGAMGKPPLSLRKRMKMCLDCAKGMAYLHARRIVHRDLKTQNLLVTNDGQVKVCDFGESRLKNGICIDTNHLAGTVNYMAPEAFRDPACSEKCDVFSFAMVLWECVALQVPYQGLPDPHIMYAVMQEHRRPDLPLDCDPRVLSLMQRCWAEDPEARPSFADITAELSATVDSLYSGKLKDQA